MTTRQLENKIQVISAGCGNYIVIVDGERYHSNNSIAYDRISEHKRSEGLDAKKHMAGGYTYKQALQAFYDETKQ